MTLETVEDFSRGHGHQLPDADGPRKSWVYDDGCYVIPTDNGGWFYVVKDERVHRYGLSSPLHPETP